MDNRVLKKSLMLTRKIIENIHCFDSFEPMIFFILVSLVTEEVGQLSHDIFRPMILRYFLSVSKRPVD